MISVRSYLTAGTAAVVGASAIALAPVMSAPALSPSAVPAPAVAEIALTGVTLPLSDVMGVLQTLGGLGGSLTGALGAFLPQQFINEVVAEVLNQTAPLITTAAGEVVGYVGTALTGLLVGPDSIPARVGAAVGNIPAVLSAVVEALSNGDIATAIQVVTTGLAAPLTEVGQTLADAGRSFQDFLAGELTAVVGLLPGILLSAIEAVFGNTVEASLDTVNDALSGLFGGLLPAPGAPAGFGAAAAVVAGEDVTARGALSSPAPIAEVPVRAVEAPAEGSAAPVVTSAVVEPESLAPAAVPAEVVAPVTRPRLVDRLPVLAESTAAGPSAETRPKPTERGTRASAERSSSGTATRAGRTAG